MSINKKIQKTITVTYSNYLDDRQPLDLEWNYLIDQYQNIDDDFAFSDPTLKKLSLSFLRTIGWGGKHFRIFLLGVKIGQLSSKGLLANEILKPNIDNFFNKGKLND